jgi:hypothetical protein
VTTTPPAPAHAPIESPAMRDRRLQLLVEIKFLLGVLVALAAPGVFLISMHR